MLIGCYNYSVILTYLGICSSLIGILKVNDLRVAMICLMIAGICDMFDGCVARKCKRDEKAKAFGIQIDSLADVVNFVVFPIVILYSILRNNTLFSGFVSENWYYYAAFMTSIVFVLGGVIRLAWFNITTTGITKYYQGLPVTFISMILPFVYSLVQNTIWVKEIVLGTLLVVALLFVLDIPIPKPRGVFYIVFILIGGLITFLLFR